MFDSTLTGLQEGKRQLRDARRNMPLPEKVKQIIELQKIAIPTIRRRRALLYWERVWPLRPENRTSKRHD
jgi:hypothetical protein